MPSITMTDCPDCGCGGSSGDFCVGLVTVNGRSDDDAPYEERTEYAGISQRVAFVIGASMSEKLNGEATGFHGLITEVQFVTCYENIVDAILALSQHNPHFEFE